MFLLSITNSILSIITGSVNIASGEITKYGYIGIFGLMTLEGMSFPVPSEVIMPLVGFLSAKGTLLLPIALFVGILGNLVGILVDYYIAYFLGKDVVYKHLHKFHIKKQTMDSIDKWFEKNGNFAVFATRMIPIVRGVISFPAGFAKMNIKKFIIYSLLGSIIWDVVLALFGYYALPTGNAILILISLGVLGIILYIIYIKFMRSLKKQVHATR